MSVSAGIVSALNRDIQDTPFDDYIQTDVGDQSRQLRRPHGRSRRRGGRRRYSTLQPRAEPAASSGSALPFRPSTTKFVVGRLLDPSHPKPGWLGLTLQDLTPELSEALDLRGAEGFDHLSGGRGWPGEHGGAAARRYPDGDQRYQTRGLPGFHAHDRADPGRAAGAADRLAGWQGAIRHRNGRRNGRTIMPGGGVMSAQMAEAMIQKMPDPGVRLARAYRRGAQAVRHRRQGERRTGRLGGSRLRGARPRYRRRRRDHRRARRAGDHARRCATSRADRAPTTAPVPRRTRSGQERRSMGVAVDGRHGGS